MNTRSDTRLEKRPNVEQTSTNIYPSFSKQGNKTTHTNENLYCSKVIFKLDPKMHFIISTQTVPHSIIKKMRYIWNVDIWKTIRSIILPLVCLLIMKYLYEYMNVE